MQPEKTDYPLDASQWWLQHVDSSADTSAHRLVQSLCDPSLTLKHHEGQASEFHLTHMLALLGKLGVGEETLLSAAIFHAAQCGFISIDETGRQFGDGQRTLLEQQLAVVDLIERQSWPRDEQDVEGLRRLLLAMVHDPRVVFIQLADRLVLLRNCADAKQELRQKWVAQTQGLHAPLANRLGIWQLKWELEDLVFRYCEPVAYKNIARLLDQRRVDRQNYVATMVEQLSAALRENDLPADVAGRPKHLYSIYRKMQRKGLDFSQLYDIRATRVLVDTVGQCYAALGVVHSCWRPISEEFDDYISAPKPNGYQSLHTVIVGPGDLPVEVQIRTRDMHAHAELGVAAHWVYKEGTPHDASYARKVSWMRQLLDEPAGSDDSDGLLESFSDDAEDGRIYAFTPNGQVIDLPRGSTPLDFAYRVHTEIGHSCKGARVNGRIVPLTTELGNGDSVEIMRSKHASPSRDWLSPREGYLRSSRARSKVRQWFRRAEFGENLAAGRDMFDRELSKLSIPGPDMKEVAKRFNFQRSDDLLAAIGRGDLSVAQVLRPYLADQRPLKAHTVSAPPSQRSSGLVIRGVGNLMTQLARCCNPVAGDRVMGYITQGRGVTVHRSNCKSIQKMIDEGNPRLIEVEWGSHEAQQYSAKVRVSAWDRRNLLSDVSATVANAGLSVAGLQSRVDPATQHATIDIELLVNDLEQLSSTMSRLQGLPNVERVERTA
ncbi:MAG: GTP pyrophosphokinase [Lysobacteraceae bacterium]|nr:MAG: GTP pyrophosphokinase [Xanthomonadaceae bacterium]